MAISMKKVNKWQWQPIMQSASGSFSQQYSTNTYSTTSATSSWLTAMPQTYAAYMNTTSTPPTPTPIQVVPVDMDVRQSSYGDVELGVRLRIASGMPPFDLDDMQAAIQDAVASMLSLAQQAERVGLSLKEFRKRHGSQQPQPRYAPPRDFNRFINASDLMEQFIAYAGDEGVRQGEVLQLPVELFVKWLVIKACEADHEEPNVTLELPAPGAQPRCLACQRWMRKGIEVPLHPACAPAYLEKVAA